MSTIRRYAAATTTALLLAGSIAACSTGDDTVPDGSAPPDSNVAPPEQPEGEDEAPEDTEPGAGQDPSEPPAEGEPPFEGDPGDAQPPAEEEPPAEGEPPAEDPDAGTGAGPSEAGWLAFELPADAAVERDEEGMWSWSMPVTDATDPHPSELLVVQGPENHRMTGTFDEEIAAFEQMMVEGLPEDVNWEDGEVDAADGLRVYRFETLGLEPGEVHWIVENTQTGNGELMHLTVTVNGESTEMVEAIDATLQPSAG